MKLLTKEFLDKYSDEPDDMNQLSKFVFYRTYSRWIDSLDRRETFKEAISRAVEYNVGISVKHMSSIGYDVPESSIRDEAETLFDNIYNRRQFLSGRTHWIGGADTGISEKSPMSNFNCAFLEVNKWEDLSELFYLLLIGTGVGVKCFKEDTKKLAHIRRDYNLTHSEFKPVPKESRLEETLLKDLGNGYAKIYIADSKEGK